MPIKVEFWPRDSERGQIADVEVERDEYDVGRVALRTFVNGCGSVTSYYLDREAAIVLVRDVLAAVALSVPNEGS